MAISVSQVWAGWCLTNMRRVVKLRHAFIVKYLGNRTRWTSPKVCLGSAKYSDRPETKVIQIWAPMCMTKDAR